MRDLWICNECGEKFTAEDSGTYTERHEFWGAPCYETFMVCPACGSEFIEEYEEEQDD